jgi:hypothetical protein
MHSQKALEKLVLALNSLADNDCVEVTMGSDSEGWQKTLPLLSIYESNGVLYLDVGTPSKLGAKHHGN